MYLVEIFLKRIFIQQKDYFGLRFFARNASPLNKVVQVCLA